MFKKLALVAMLALTATSAKAESDAYISGKLFVLLTIGKSRCGLVLTAAGQRAITRTGVVVLDGGDGTLGGAETGRALRELGTDRACTIIATNWKGLNDDR
jgi:hypothetical protein